MYAGMVRVLAAVSGEGVSSRGGGRPSRANLEITPFGVALGWSRGYTTGCQRAMTLTNDKRHDQLRSVASQTQSVGPEGVVKQSLSKRSQSTSRWVSYQAMSPIAQKGVGFSELAGDFYVL